jgi:hypothetical protein
MTEFYKDLSALSEVLESKISNGLASLEKKLVREVCVAVTGLCAKHGETYPNLTDTAERFVKNKLTAHAIWNDPSEESFDAPLTIGNLLDELLSQAELVEVGSHYEEED